MHIHIIHMHIIHMHKNIYISLHIPRRNKLSKSVTVGSGRAGRVINLLRKFGSSSRLTMYIYPKVYAYRYHTYAYTYYTHEYLYIPSGFYPHRHGCKPRGVCVCIILDQFCKDRTFHLERDALILLR